MTSTILPGDILQLSQPNAPKLGLNLHLLTSQAKAQESQEPTSQIIAASQAGLLSSDNKRNATTSILPFPSTRYIPCQNDLIIAQIHHSSPDFFHCIISPNSPHAFLGQLAFEGATKKTRPQLKAGELVYARILSVGVGAGGEVELTCVNPATGKAEPDGLGSLHGGMVFDVSTLFASRLMMTGPERKDGAGPGGVIVLEELGRKFESYGGFEIAVGRNGKVWVDSSAEGDVGVIMVVAIGRCLRETDEKRLDVVEQKKLVLRVLKEIGVGK
ncbi:exosome complex exonuclease Rrp40 [Trichophyton violaceum]|uniref:Exosome complex exonuclease Rrp40 n=1 Tax=Trichophyton violaceum TaxID=34388 RepID=A0A178FU91_TRIVO|nr:exosome complex exonuclease Rrp40 [Trichophyton violaceum]